MLFWHVFVLFLYEAALGLDGGFVMTTVLTEPAPTAWPVTFELRGDDEVQIWDSWGDYKYHKAFEVWPPYDPKFTIPAMRGWLHRQGQWEAVPSFDKENDPNYNETTTDTSEAGDGGGGGASTKVKRLWVDSLWSSKDLNQPPIVGDPFTADSAGYDIPGEWEFQHRKFNRTESTFAIKYWMMRTSATGCTALVARNCPGATQNGLTLITDNDEAIANCLLQLPISCRVVVSGYTNFTEPHAPDVCCSNILAMTLPTPGMIVPHKDCQYGDIIVHNFVPLSGLRDSYYQDQHWFDPKYLHALGKQPQEPWLNPACLNAASEPYNRGCQARIEFGHDLFTYRDRHSKVALEKSMKDSEDDESAGGEAGGGKRDSADEGPYMCYPPDFLQGMVLTPEKDYRFYPSEYPLLQSGGRGNMTQYMMDAGRMNLLLKIENLRNRLGDRSVSQFTMQVSGSDFFDWCGPFTGIEVPMKCNTHGLKNFYSEAEEDDDAAAESSWGESNSSR